MWSAVGKRCSSVRGRNPLLTAGVKLKGSCNTERALLYGATDIKGTSGAEYVQHWSNVRVVTVAQIMNHFAPGFTALETDSGDRMVCLSDGLRLILCCFFCFCALSLCFLTLGTLAIPAHWDRITLTCIKQLSKRIWKDMLALQASPTKCTGSLSRGALSSP